MGKVFVVGTADTKAAEIAYVADLLCAVIPAVGVIDLGTRRPDMAPDITAAAVAASHPDGPGFLQWGDRGQVVAAMGLAFAHWCAASAAGVDGIIGLGGGGGTAMICAGMRTLPLGVPKVMVSTLASGDVAPYIDISDIIMVPAVTDLAGLNRVSRIILHNAAQALIGMMTTRPDAQTNAKSAIGLTMFGVTTTAVMAIADALRDRFDPLVFHATGTGGRAMEALAAQGHLAGIIDITTTEIADLLVGGVLACAPTRLDVVAQTGLPWVGSPGALDMVNFWAPDTVPDRFRDRLFYHHNANVTLMRTTPDESARIGAWLAAKLNTCDGPVRLLIPELGVSALDIKGGPFHDPVANAALFGAITHGLRQTANRRIIAVPLHINDPAFAALACETFLSLI